MAAPQLALYLVDRQEAFSRACSRWRTVPRDEDPVGRVRRVAWNLVVSRRRRTRSALRFLSGRRRAQLEADGPGPVEVQRDRGISSTGGADAAAEGKAGWAYATRAG